MTLINDAQERISEKERSQIARELVTLFPALRNFFAVPPEKLSWTSLTVAASPKDPLNVEIHKTDQVDNHQKPSTNPISFLLRIP